MKAREVVIRHAVLCAGLIVGLSACNGTEDQVYADSSRLQDAPAAAQGKEASVKSMNLGDQIKFAKEDLAQRLGIEPGSIRLYGARRVNWRSGALGCPQPGLNYTQALVPGVLILLQVDDKSFGYHAKDGAKPFYCPRERIEAPASIQDEDLA